ncbi:PROTEIN PHOSPHATASE 1 REGULATORY SUBUNIT [Salix koriyanagi]|uniref:PROTEIN PHOSPHATASE 1 REGULATORY SUBUNIT n=1 Tax=Salix koriyanagi TaxID=2511006 RepID=A0A9Q0UNV8_9ROSI|nr:PROTEIN PHOSPHATASE 1 REGULATORY SUBUNIT [Salix koriyanagi]
MTRQLTGKKDDTPLHSAARAGNLGAVMEILTGTGEEDLKELDSEGVNGGPSRIVHDLSDTTAAHAAAAAQGHIEIVNFLLDAGSSLATIAKSNGETALHSAARNGHVEVVQALFTIGYQQG